ncbi:MAG TPA: HIT domain-containing protein [Actinomycetota bacterium]|nr:HIT domain-containing protein [Actinomycetota bacterium]
MDRIWSPWRMAYIQAAKEQADDDGGCIFCDLPAEGDDARAKILARSELAFAILNSFPYNPGHLMVTPFRHVGDFGDLRADELAEVDALVARSIRALEAEMAPHGFNLGMNLGRVAGAGIPGHVHWHVVPRWNGDTNFMPVVGQTRVLPELLEESFARLLPRFDAG